MDETGGQQPVKRETARLADLPVEGLPADAPDTPSAATDPPHGEVDPVRNTNHLVGRKGWDILLSKTGFTNEAGRCLVMRLRSAGRTVLVVLMDAAAGTGRTLDALNVNRLVAGVEPVSALTPEFASAPPVKRAVKTGVRAKKKPQEA